MNTSFDILLVIIIFNILAWSVLFARFRHYKNKVSYECLVRFSDMHHAFLNRAAKLQKGLKDGANLDSRVALKFAERAFSLASSANLAIMHLQKLLQNRPKPFRKEDVQQNSFTQDQVMKTLGGSKDYDGFDWLYPILTEEQREILDTAIEHTSKYPAEGNEDVRINAGHRTTTSSNI